MEEKKEAEGREERVAKLLGMTVKELRKKRREQNKLAKEQGFISIEKARKELVENHTLNREETK